MCCSRKGGEEYDSSSIAIVGGGGGRCRMKGKMTQTSSFTRWLLDGHPVCPPSFHNVTSPPIAVVLLLLLSSETRQPTPILESDVRRAGDLDDL